MKRDDLWQLLRAWAVTASKLEAAEQRTGRPVTRVREALVLPGGGAGIDTDKAKRWGISRLWFEADDPVASPASLAACRDRGVDVGLVRDPTWPRAPLSSTALADRMSADLTAKGYGFNSGPTTCGAMFDNEQHDPLAILLMLKRWRQLRTTRVTRWTLEPFQEGWFTPELVGLINADPNLTIVPQGYLGTPRLYPVALDEMKQRLVSRGVAPSKIVAFLNGEQPIPYGWAGIIWDFAILPASPPITL